MANQLPRETATPSGQAAAAIAGYWGWLLALGIVSVVLGALGLALTAVLTVGSVIFFGALLFVGGVAQLGEAFKHAGWRSTLWHVLIAVLYVVGGGVMVYDPIGASIALTLLFAALLVASGAFRAVIALQHRPATGWTWLLAGAVLSILLGAIVLAQWPVSGLWVIGLFVAVELLVNGWSCITLALAARRLRAAA
ncbi:MAG: DUF308 domain-containing protein [Burkholderiales bacterium]|nr:DUF308 domain-containing protein [Burkholderiales bacterium]